MYNRERYIGRTLKNCLDQSFGDFEIITVDDGSTDRSAKVVRGFADARIRLIRHRTNQERLIARNTGARAAKGEWLIWFDSDDEMVPDALAIMKQRAEELPADVYGMRFMCRLDSGRISPDPPYLDEIWDYGEYIRWIESHYGKWSETMPVVRRETAQSVLFPEDRWYTGEMQYHLDFAFQYKTRACTDVLRIYHLDADNNTWSPDIGRMLRAAPASAARMNQVMLVHGRALEKWAPVTYDKLSCGMIAQLLLSGQRTRALAALPQALSRRPYNPRSWLITALGLTSPALLAHAKARWNSLRMSRTR